MRTIKFRGKRVDYGYYAYGYYYWNDCENKPYIMVDCHEEHEVEFGTIGQLTGLHDKDKNGREIWEHDVLLLDDGVTQRVFFASGSWFAGSMVQHICDVCEVIEEIKTK